jgi:hypothetical protein
MISPTPSLRLAYHFNNLFPEITEILSKYEIQSSCWSRYESSHRGWTALSVPPVVRTQSTNIQNPVTVQNTVSSFQWPNASCVASDIQFIFLPNTRVEPG